MNSDDVGSIVRTTVATLGGSLVTQGVLMGDQLNAASGAIGVLVTLAWSLWQKYRQRQEVEKHKTAAQVAYNMAAAQIRAASTPAPPPAAS